MYLLNVLAVNKTLEKLEPEDVYTAAYTLQVVYQLVLQSTTVIN